MTNQEPAQAVAFELDAACGRTRCELPYRPNAFQWGRGPNGSPDDARREGSNKRSPRRARCPVGAQNPQLFNMSTVRRFCTVGAGCSGKNSLAARILSLPPCSAFRNPIGLQNLGLRQNAAPGGRVAPAADWPRTPLRSRIAPDPYRSLPVSPVARTSGSAAAADCDEPPRTLRNKLLAPISWGCPEKTHERLWHPWHDFATHLRASFSAGEGENRRPELFASARAEQIRGVPERTGAGEQTETPGRSGVVPALSPGW
jgi:hypothetical protein